MGLDAKTYWLSDRQSQCNFDSDLWTDADTDTDWVRRDPESRVQHGAKKTEVKIRLPGRAVRMSNSEVRVFGLCCKGVKWITVVTTGKSNKSSYKIQNPLITVALPSKHATMYYLNENLD
jgi:hypothetical protein